MSEPCPPGFRDFILTRDHHQCVWLAGGVRCTGAERHGVSLSHVTDRSRLGGRGGWWPWNVEVLCGSGTTGHHGWREHHPEEAARLGHRAPSGDPWMAGMAALWEVEMAAVDWVQERMELLDRRLHLQPPKAWWVPYRDRDVVYLEDLLTGRDALEA